MLRWRLRFTDRAFRRHLRARRGQRAPIDLAVGGERHRRQKHERRRQHRFGQTARQSGTQRRGIDLVAIDDDIRNEATVAGAIFAQQCHCGLHAGQHRQRAIDFAQFDTDTAQLDLMIPAADELQRIVAVPAREIAGAVHACVLFRAEMVFDEAFRGEVGRAQITARHAMSADVQLTDHATRHRLTMRVQQIHAHARQRPADRHVGRCDFGTIDGRHQRRAYRRFSRAVVIAERHPTPGGLGETTHLFDRHAFAADHHQTQFRQQRFALRAQRPAFAPAPPQCRRRVDGGDPEFATETLQFRRP